MLVYLSGCSEWLGWLFNDDRFSVSAHIFLNVVGDATVSAIDVPKLAHLPRMSGMLAPASTSTSTSTSTFSNAANDRTLIAPWRPLAFAVGIICRL